MKLKLKYAIAITTGTLLIITALVLGLLGVKHLRGLAIQEESNWSSVMASALAKAITRDTLARDKIAVRDVLRRVKESNEKISYLVVVDFKDQILTATTDRAIPEIAAMKREANPIGTVRSLEYAGHNVVDYSYPLIEGLNAHLHIGINQDPIIRSIETTTTAFISGGAIITLVGIALAFVLGTKISSPISRIEHASRQYGKNNVFDETLVNETHIYEVNNLINSFKEMVSLRKADEHTLQLLNTQLEEMVAERTAKVEEQSAIINQIHDPIITLDLDGNIIDLNRGAEDKLRIKATELIGSPMHTLYADGSADDFTQSLLTPVIESGSISSEANLRNGLGEVFPALLSLTLIHDAQSRSQRIACYAVNITQQKQAQETMRQAKEVAEAANRAKSEFLSSMSHEIRTPMNGVLGMLNLLRDSELNTEQREFADTALGSAESLLVLLNDILDFSKIEAGKLELEYVDFNLRELVERVSGMMALSAHQKGLEIGADINELVPERLNGDPNRLQQILTNLFGNGIKFTEQGEVTLLVERVSGDSQHDLLKFSVCDTGIGIPLEAQKRIFDSFIQADGSTTRKYGGTGLGLTISKQLSMLMGGDLGVESTPGRGSTFWFTAKLQKARSAAPQLSPPDAFKRMYILIVDDNETNRAILEHQMESWGIGYACAGDGIEALSLLRESSIPFDLILLDMMMPNMDGLQMVSTMRQEQISPATRIIMLTSLNKEGDMRKAEELGIDLYLTKPVKQSQLYDAIATILNPGVSTGSITETDTYSRDNRDARVERILIAEDNKVNQKVVQGLLKKLGFSTEIANNGKEALDRVMQQEFDLLFMDCQMPEMDGYEATRNIRNSIPSEQLPIVAMTANAMEGDMEKCLAYGMDDYISKPLKVDKLKAMLSKWLPEQEQR